MEGAILVFARLPVQPWRFLEPILGHHRGVVEDSGQRMEPLFVRPGRPQGPVAAYWAGVRVERSLQQLTAGHHVNLPDFEPNFSV